MLVAEPTTIVCASVWKAEPLKDQSEDRRQRKDSNNRLAEVRAASLDKLGDTMKIRQRRIHGASIQREAPL